MDCRYRPMHGIDTPMRMEFENELDKRRVSLRVAEVDYEVPIPEEYFSTLALVRASIASPRRSEAERRPP